MKHVSSTVRTAALSAALAGMLAAALPASAAVPGITGVGYSAGVPSAVSFALQANESYSTQPDGASVYSWGYGCNGAASVAFGGYLPSQTSSIGTCGLMQIPGPTLIVEENSTVTVTLTNNLPVAAGNTSILFPGFQVSANVVTTPSFPTSLPAASPLTVAFSTDPTYVDGGVAYHATATNGLTGKLTLVTSNPSQGQYSVSGGTYTFNSADASQPVDITGSTTAGSATTTATTLVTLPAPAPLTVTVPSGAGYVDTGVVYGATATRTGAFTKVTGTPAIAGQYAVSGNVYTFSAADATQPVIINGTATVASGVPGVLTQEAQHGGTVTYTFVASKPGTYAYYSGTQGDLQVEMGLYGAIIVLPNQTATFTNCTTSPTLATDYRLAHAAYDHPQTCYDREYLFQLAEMQSSIHDEALAQKQACEALLATTPTASCAPIAVHSEPYHPNYFLINGRSMPDDMDPEYAPMYPNQPYNGNPHMHPNELVLVRVIGQGHIQHPLHTHANHVRVLARDGNLLLVPNDTNSKLPGGAPRLAGPLEFTFPTVSGQTVDAIFAWTGKGLNWDMYGHNDTTNKAVCVPDALGFYTVNSNPPAPPTAPNYGEYCADHNKPIPITPADPQIVANGLWYGGTPYLGLSESAANGFPSTPLPPGTAKQNMTAGYAYMWHSHNEREITTNDVFPGGMMMMLIIDPPGSTIDETK